MSFLSSISYSRLIAEPSALVVQDVNCARIYDRQFTVNLILISFSLAVRTRQGLPLRNPDSCVNNHGTMVLVGRPGVGGKCSPLGRGGEAQLLSRIYSSPESILALLSLSLYFSLPPFLSSPFISGTRQGGA